MIFLILLFAAILAFQCFQLGYSYGEKNSRKECKEFPLKCWTYNGPHDHSGCGVVSEGNNK